MVALGEMLLETGLFVSLPEAVPHQRQVFPVRHGVFAEADVSHCPTDNGGFLVFWEMHKLTPVYRSVSGSEITAHSKRGLAVTA